MAKAIRGNYLTPAPTWWLLPHYLPRQPHGTSRHGIPIRCHVRHWCALVECLESSTLTRVHWGNCRNGKDSITAIWTIPPAACFKKGKHIDVHYYCRVTSSKEWCGDKFDSPTSLLSTFPTCTGSSSTLKILYKTFSHEGITASKEIHGKIFFCKSVSAVYKHIAHNSIFLTDHEFYNLITINRNS